MATMNISLPEGLRNFVDKRVAESHYSSSSEYVRELIRQDQDRANLRAALLAGRDSPLGSVVDGTFFDGLLYPLIDTK